MSLAKSQSRREKKAEILEVFREKRSHFLVKELFGFYLSQSRKVAKKERRKFKDY